MSGDPLAEAYLAWCASEHEAPNTTAARRRVLRSVGNAGTATREDVEAWWAGRADRAPATRVADLSMLRAFYRWAAMWEHRTDDPTVRLRPPRTPNRVPRPARRDDVRGLIQSLPADLSRAVVLGAYLGARVSESARLDWLDIDEDRGVARIEKSKGQKTRLVPVSAAVLALLGENRVGNVVTGGHGALTPRHLGERLNYAMRKRGVAITSHQLRHLFGTTAYEASGGDLLVVRDLMGHVSTQTTASYAQPSMDVARRIADAMLD